jgi:hypothetical protein
MVSGKSWRAFEEKLAFMLIIGMIITRKGSV